MWFDGPKPPEKSPINSPKNYFAQQKAGSSLEKTMSKLPNIVYKGLFTFKGGYAIEMDALHWYGSWFLIQI